MDIKKHFTIAIKENEGAIFKIATFYTNFIEDRDDLYQEIVYQLWKSFPSFQERAKISTWIYRVALNTAIYYLNKSKRKVPTIPVDVKRMQCADGFDAEEEKRVSILYKHINLLSLLDKGIVLLYLEGKSHEEIAAITGLSKTNVGSKLSRIKEKLRSQIIKTENYGT